MVQTLLPQNADGNQTTFCHNHYCHAHSLRPWSSCRVFRDLIFACKYMLEACINTQCINMYKHTMVHLHTGVYRATFLSQKERPQHWQYSSNNQTCSSMSLSAATFHSLWLVQTAVALSYRLLKQVNKLCSEWYTGQDKCHPYTAALSTVINVTWWSDASRHYSGTSSVIHKISLLQMQYDDYDVKKKIYLWKKQYNDDVYKWHK